MGLVWPGSESYHSLMPLASTLLIREMSVNSKKGPSRLAFALVGANGYRGFFANPVGAWFGPEALFCMTPPRKKSRHSPEFMMSTGLPPLGVAMPFQYVGYA